MPRASQDIQSQCQLDAWRNARVNKACRSLGRLGVANKEQRDAVWREFIAAHDELRKPLDYRAVSDKKVVEIGKELEIRILNWLVQLGEKYPTRSPDSHARRNQLGVTKTQCLMTWRRLMPELMREAEVRYRNHLEATRQP